MTDNDRAARKGSSTALKIKKTLTAGAAIVGMSAGMVAFAPAAQADTHTQWYNHQETCKRATDLRVKHYRHMGYRVSVQRYCRGEQYIGYMPQYQSIIYYN